MRNESPIPVSAVIVLVGSVITGLLALVLLALVVSELVVSATVVVLGLVTLALSFRCWRRNRSLLSVFGDRVVVQRIKAGEHGERWVMEYGFICRIALAHRSISIWDDKGRFVRMTIDPLHAQDAFDFLTERIASANPDCVIC